MDGFVDPRTKTLKELGLTGIDVTKCDTCMKSDVQIYANTTSNSAWCLPCAQREDLCVQIEDYFDPDEIMAIWGVGPCQCGRVESVFSGTNGMADGLCFDCAVKKLCPPMVKSAVKR
jgi:hypothetical protein